MLKTSSFSEYVMHDAEIISERVRGLMTDGNEDLVLKHGLVALSGKLRDALLSFEADARSRASDFSMTSCADLEIDPQPAAA